MASAVERRREEHSRRSRSPARDRERRRSPPARRKDSPARARSPAKTSESHRDRERSPPREKVKEHVRSPKHAREKSRSRSPARRRDSRSPSPRTKRLRRAQAEREMAHVSDGDHRKPSHREGRDTGRHREHAEGRDASKERKAERGGWLMVIAASPLTGKSRTRVGTRSMMLGEIHQGIASLGGRMLEDVNSRGHAVPGSEDADSVAKMTAAAEALEAKEKQKPSFELSGKLAEETNRVAGKLQTSLQITLPAASSMQFFSIGMPTLLHFILSWLHWWRSYCDHFIFHAFAFRLVEKEQPDGMMSKKVRPYLMDLDSTNGTYINENRIEPRRYYELFEKDTIKFGNSRYDHVTTDGRGRWRKERSGDGSADEVGKAEEDVRRWGGATCSGGGAAATGVAGEVVVPAVGGRGGAAVEERQCRGRGGGSGRQSREEGGGAGDSSRSHGIAAEDAISPAGIRRTSSGVWGGAGSWPPSAAGEGAWAGTGSSGCAVEDELGHAGEDELERATENELGARQRIRDGG
ncbi:hypothetical protein PR202_gb00920 [Eleusine coracana subsp. coracana]|uniref:FHA domain-containing protein n=1 Tax=Eleusine coracana subsp. coracana TaxID=191504 RepID=A0AAV5DVB3_ELECO|nr:hypothetical protein PR202_gb00920 [Eleusine coracana subsp. coracana]